MKEILEELARNIQNPRELNQRFEYIEQEYISPKVFKNTSYYESEGKLRYSLIRKSPNSKVIFMEMLEVHYPMTVDEARILLRKKILQSLVNYAVLSSMHFIEEYDKTTNSK